jgi:hypothetical protein
MRHTLNLLTVFVWAGLATVAGAADFVPLFDGQTLDNFTQRGGKADYRIEGDTIVGSSVPNTPNSFLCTNKEYGDFILELEFKVDPGLNSGVQIRSEYLEQGKEVEYKDKTLKLPAKRVFGYQVEIDPSDRAWSGGIYDESRRGWLNNLEKNDAARKAFKKGEWNKFRIECRGDSIKTWLNGVPAADLNDSLTPKGFIALQVHGVGEKKDTLSVRWKNINIQELEAPAPPKDEDK